MIKSESKRNAQSPATPQLLTGYISYHFLRMETSLRNNACSTISWWKWFAKIYCYLQSASTLKMYYISLISEKNDTRSFQFKLISSSVLCHRRQGAHSLGEMSIKRSLTMTKKPYMFALMNKMVFFWGR